MQQRTPPQPQEALSSYKEKTKNTDNYNLLKADKQNKHKTRQTYCHKNTDNPHLNWKQVASLPKPLLPHSSINIVDKDCYNTVELKKADLSDSNQRKAK